MSAHKSALRIFQTASILAALLLTVATPALAYLAPANGKAAALVLGQPNFSGSAAGAGSGGMTDPNGVAVDPATHKVFVADYNNNRVLRYGSLYALSNGAPAEAVLGQPNFAAHAAHLTRSGMHGPASLFVDAGGRLWVADSANQRVLRFNGASAKASGASADGVLGQPDFTHAVPAAAQNTLNYPLGVFADAAGRLWVADDGNSRILRFDAAASKADGANADGVLGQPDFSASAPATSQSGMAFPIGVFVDAGGSLWVGDWQNDRVLRFDNAAAQPNGANADGVLGQPDFVHNAAVTTRSGMDRPTGLAVDNVSGQLYVADMTNSRILVFNSAAGLANGANASAVLGQKNFTTGTPNSGGVSAASLAGPVGVFFDAYARVLLAADAYNSRVLMYGKPSLYFTARSAAAGDGWLLESAPASGLGGSMSAAGELLVGDDAANRQYRGLLSFKSSALPASAQIHSISLKVKRSGFVGTDPSASLGVLLVEVRKGSFGTPALQVTDFQTLASTTPVGYLTPISTQPGWYQLALPAADWPYVNRAGLTQFRLRFALNNNGDFMANYDTFLAGDAASATDRPRLVVEYTLP